MTVKYKRLETCILVTTEPNITRIRKPDTNMTISTKAIFLRPKLYPILSKRYKTKYIHPNGSVLVANKVKIKKLSRQKLQGFWRF